MKTQGMAIALLILTASQTPGQVAKSSPSTESEEQVAMANLPAETPYAVTERGAHYRVWRKTIYEIGANGQSAPRLHEFIELATGLHFWDATTGQWKESSEAIETFPGGAVARHGQHQVIFANDLATAGAIDMQTPDGRRMRSHVLGLSYFDSASGKSVFVAEVTNCQGVVINTNQVLYENAFTDFKAAVLYTYTKDGFTQDVIVHERPPLPENYGLNSATTRLQILTEFLSAPTPRVLEKVIPSGAGDGETLLDETLDFGAMKMGAGAAFVLDKETGGSSAVKIPVAKQWLLLEGRTILVEEVTIPAAAEQLGALPVPKQAGVGGSKSAVRRTASSRRQLPAPRLAQAARTNGMQTAKLSVPLKGFVLDYNTLNASLTNYTFQNDTTYYISGAVNLYQTNTFEGGTVLKFSTAGSITLIAGADSTINWKAGPYRPVIFTAKDNNTVGEAISGSTGNPSGYYANPALSLPSLTSAPMLVNVRISYAKNGLQFASGNVTVYDAQFLSCQNGITLNGSSLFLGNALFAKTLTNFVFQSAATNSVQNATFSGANYLASGTGSGSVLAFTNCILANVTNLFAGSVTSNGSYNGFYNAANFGSDTFTNTGNPFQVVGAGSYYLANGCAFTNIGTTSVDPTLLADIQTKTTYPPLVISNTVLLISTNFSIQAERDKLYPDLGYHYDPVDYMFGSVKARSNVTFTAGAVMGWFELVSGAGYGLYITNDCQAVFEGALTQPCVLTRYSAVQEGGTGLWTLKGWLGALIGQGYNDSAHRPQAKASFTRFYALAGDANHFRDYNCPSALTANHCEFYGGGMGGYGAGLNLTNCLFERAYIGLECTCSDFLYMRNCTMRGRLLFISHGGSTWSVLITDGVFDGTTINMNDYSGGDTNITYCDYNAFLSGSNRLAVWGSHDITNLTSFNWQQSYLGNRYLPSDSSLINAGSRTADVGGLYHFTTQTSQGKETNSVVDIGYHYVATDGYGVPLDSDGDGIPDYLEDPNGNGLVDFGETDWQSATDLGLKILITRPKNNSTIP